MKRFLLSVSTLGFFVACGPPPDVRVLAENEGGIFLIAEMPADTDGDAVAEGTSDTTIVGLNVEALTLDGTLLFSKSFNSNDLNLASGRWPTTAGTCLPLRDGIPAAEVPANFLPGNSACITFALIHSFNEENQADTELITTIAIEAVDGGGGIRARINRTVIFERGVFLGDPETAVKATDLSPFVATLQI